MNAHALSHDFLQALPKTDLHCHLDGSLRLSTLIELAHEQNVRLPTTEPAKLKEALGLGQTHSSLESYLQIFSLTCSVMQTREAIKRVAFELVEDAALENIWHLEIRYCPSLHLEKGLSGSEVVEATLQGIELAKTKYKISVGLILCGLRHFDPAKNLEIAKLAVSFSDCGVVGYDLAGPELGYGAKAHLESFLHAAHHRLSITAHAGEGDGFKSIEQAIYDCNAQRIGHGTRLLESDSLFRYVVDHRIGIEACLTSNVQTGVVANLKSHPIRQFFDAGARVSLNTDNRLVSDTTMTKEFIVAHEVVGFTLPALKKLILNGFKSAFLPFDQKRALLERVSAHFKSHSPMMEKW